MDLTRNYPRSVRDTMGGVVMLARTVDKAKAAASGKIGEYHYNCPMDQAVFAFLDIDLEEFLATVKSAHDDGEIEIFIKLHAAQKTPAQIERFNTDFVQRAPAPGSDGATSFTQLLTSVAPERTDITTWADLLDLDERREVPRRTTVV